MNVLIFGENSYIGNEFASFAAEHFPDRINVSKISSRGNLWENADFSGYDCLLYCAGIAHRRAPDRLHIEVNCNMAMSAAKMARKHGVRHFVYLSSLAAKSGHSVKFRGMYGESKKKAEKLLFGLESDDFIITIARPPMVYGRNCKGNFQKLVKLVRLLPVFPYIENKRSMIYIANLCYFLAEIIQRQMPGTFTPQNKEPVCTSAMAVLIAESLNKKIRLTRLFNFAVFMFLWLPPFNKLFTDFVHESSGFELVDFVNFEESIALSLNYSKTQ